MSGKDALLPFNADEETREANLDAILLSGGVTLSRLLMPSFDNSTNITTSSFYRRCPEEATFKDPPPDFTSLLGRHQFMPFPKSEPADLPPPPSSHFLLTPFPPTMGPINPAPFHFHHLPHLRSLDTQNNNNLIISSSSSTSKRPRYQLPANVNNNNNVTVARHLPVPTSALARQRRIRMSDKTRCLQKLIPLDRHMDTATLYEETYKYIKFLEAQITILRYMPVHAPLLPLLTPNVPRLDGIYRGLERLNRQQLLQVLVNSPVAQTVMYANGWCVFSAEQLASLIRTEHEKVVEQQFL